MLDNMTNQATTYTDQQIDDWGMIFGASAEIWSWWHSIEHVTGDWNTPGAVNLRIEDPDAEIGAVIEAVRTPAEIFLALAAATEKYPHLFIRHPEYGDLDLDAGSADVVLQVALFGEAVYG